LRIDEQKPLHANVFQSGTERQESAAANSGDAYVVEAHGSQRVNRL